jgi:hypothetical protein
MIRRSALGVVGVGLTLAFLLIGSRLCIPNDSPRAGASQVALAEDRKQSSAIHPHAQDFDELINGRSGGEGPGAVDLVVRGTVVAKQDVAVPFTPPSPPPTWKPQVASSPTTSSGGAPRPDYQTDYLLRVEELVVGVALSPDVVVSTPAAAGAPSPRSPNPNVPRSLNPNVPSLSIGEEYLMLLIHRPDGRYTPNGAQGVLAINHGRVEPVVSDLPVLEGLRGQPCVGWLTRPRAATVAHAARW